MFRIAIEIAEIHGRVPNSIVAKGYKFSRYGAVAFILDKVRPEVLDRILDPIVPTISLGIPGVVCIDMDARPEVLRAICSAQMIVAISPQFYKMAKLIQSKPGARIVRWPAVRSIDIPPPAPLQVSVPAGMNGALTGHGNSADFSADLD